MDKFARFKYQPCIPLGEDGRCVTASLKHINLSREAATEGIVLLKNEGNALPLKKGERVALFGKATIEYIKGGGGSGDVHCPYICNIADG
ncbi:MAG: glycoside hydrolase family 3 C-terminal domain-containing protein, partial [Clostridia bacterium]|nr:glycoside hydrolase family 3 C-terminal domain-containing protein [Clostridia bacterium]